MNYLTGVAEDAGPTGAHSQGSQWSPCCSFIYFFVFLFFFFVEVVLLISCSLSVFPVKSLFFEYITLISTRILVPWINQEVREYLQYNSLSDIVTKQNTRKRMTICFLIVGRTNKVLRTMTMQL